jgi:hypothetical protein
LRADRPHAGFGAIPSRSVAQPPLLPLSPCHDGDGSVNGGQLPLMVGDQGLLI